MHAFFAPLLTLSFMQWANIFQETKQETSPLPSKVFTVGHNQFMRFHLLICFLRCIKLSKENDRCSLQFISYKAFLHPSSWQNERKYERLTFYQGLSHLLALLQEQLQALTCLKMFLSSHVKVTQAHTLLPYLYNLSSL